MRLWRVAGRGVRPLPQQGGPPGLIDTNSRTLPIGGVEAVISIWGWAVGGLVAGQDSVHWHFWTGTEFISWLHYKSLFGATEESYAHTSLHGNCMKMFQTVFVWTFSCNMGFLMKTFDSSTQHQRTKSLHLFPYKTTIFTQIKLRTGKSHWDQYQSLCRSAKIFLCI